VRKQAALLYDVSNAMSQRRQVFRSKRVAADGDPTVVRRIESDDKAKEGRFAASARTDEHGGGALRDRSRERRDGHRTSEAFADLFEPDHD